MLQLIAGRERGFIFTTPAKVIPNIALLFKNPAGVLAGIEDSEKYNLFYTLGHHAGAEKASHPQRTTSTFEYQTVMAWDIDGADVTRPHDYCFAISKLLNIDPASMIIVCSGNGLHYLANLRNPIRSAQAFKELKPAYNLFADKIDGELAVIGLPGKTDRAIFEPARVFRLPGTVNRKPGKPDKECQLIQYSDVANDIDLASLSGIEDMKVQNVSTADLRRTYPRPDFAEVTKECRFVCWALEHIDEVHEPQAFDLFSLLSAMNSADKIDRPSGPASARDLALWAFSNAMNSKSMATGNFDAKWEQSGKYGARKCETIAGNWGRCNECPHHGKVVTPLALKSREHISSEVNGYWVLNAKGQPTHPHYEELARIFAAESPHIVTPDGRLFLYNGTHYILSETQPVKSWLEHKLTPSEPMRENHRIEFVHKVKARSGVTQAEQDRLFVASVVGKINCSNGIVDIKTGEVLPHDPRYGFQYCLNYAYEPGQSSEFFLEWLGTVMEDRTELMDAALDTMAYCLWPAYDDHVFTYFTGNGKNGKSTLIRVIEELVGAINVSSVSIQSLTTNRFAPAALEGKLVNLSGESGGSYLTSEQLNVLKTMSSGETMQVEKKGQDSFAFRNMAKMIFSANLPPKFAESGDSVKRRLLVIPFDYKIDRPDCTVEHKLLSEVPAIMSMLVARTQRILAENNGRFYVSRGGSTGIVAQAKMLEAGNTAIEWATESLESSSEISDDVYVVRGEAYVHYTKWCEEAGHKYPQNRNSFCKTLVDSYVTPATSKSEVQKIGGKAQRVFRRTQWKLEANLIESVSL